MSGEADAVRIAEDVLERAERKLRPFSRAAYIEAMETIAANAQVAANAAREDEEAGL